MSGLPDSHEPPAIHPTATSLVEEAIAPLLLPHVSRPVAAGLRRDIQVATADRINSGGHDPGLARAGKAAKTAGKNQAAALAKLKPETGDA